MCGDTRQKSVKMDIRSIWIHEARLIVTKMKRPSSKEGQEHEKTVADNIDTRSVNILRIRNDNVEVWTQGCITSEAMIGKKRVHQECMEVSQGKEEIKDTTGTNARAGLNLRKVMIGIRISKGRRQCCLILME